MNSLPQNQGTDIPARRELSSNSSLPTIMLRHFALSMGLLLGATLLSGCSYDRSFMQMDSNSGLPFFGFQWAVDSGSRPSKSASAHDDHETAPSLIDLRAPSKLDQPGRDRLDLDSERDDIRTVSIRPRPPATFIRSSHESTLAPAERVSALARDAGSNRVQFDKTASGEQLSGERNVTPIQALMPKSRSSSAAQQFQNRRAAF
jgi:hypothetical protein